MGHKAAVAWLGTLSLAAVAVSPDAPRHLSASTSPRVARYAHLDRGELWDALGVGNVQPHAVDAVETAQITVEATPKLPSGRSTATSFWDDGAPTASGRRMSPNTIASPYWPLGTRVKVTYRGRSAIGVVWDFGPAEWAVAQHDPPAIVDLAEPMMKRLTGSRENSVAVHFRVLKMGHGRVYRHSGSGYRLATR